MVRIGGLQKTSTIDYPGKLSCVVFLSGCNYNCGYCQNPQLLEDKNEAIIKEESIIDFIEERGYLDGIVISGGEPTLQELKFFIKNLKKRRKDLSIKLDTNGSHPEVLEELKKERLIDYVAMDVKSPKYLYGSVTGKNIDLRDVEKGIALTCQFPDYEFRTTIAPVDRENGDFSFMKVGEVVDIAKWIIDITGRNEHKYYLQPFVSHKSEDSRLLDSRFETFPETPKELLEEMKKEVIKYLPNCRIRN